jgi:DNA polymerase elongation subunit (family B)
MGEYYFDIETYVSSEKPDPRYDKIITIQYQRLSTGGESSEGALEILTEWDSGSERAMLDSFRQVFLTGRSFDFIPVGLNLYGYDMIVLLNRLNHHFDLKLDIGFFRDRPLIDIKPILVLMNGGNFRGHADLMGRGESGAQVKVWYEAKDYNSIISYIQREAKNFVEKYRFLKEEVGAIRFPQ